MTYLPVNTQNTSVGSSNVPVSRTETTTTTASTKENSEHNPSEQHQRLSAVHNNDIISRPTIYKEISRQVIRRKLARQRHCVVERAISPEYLDSLFPTLLQLFRPQIVRYNGGIAGIEKWKISCYLEVMPGGIPTTEPAVELLRVFAPLLDTCNDLFAYWYRQQHACNDKKNNCRSYSIADAAIKPSAQQSCRRLMTFITRYTPNPGEQALLKHVDGAGKVDGSLVVALPIDRWSDGGVDHTFEGGGLTFWDGKKDENGKPQETHYDTRSGDVALIDRAVWHQADPITRGTRWALVIFYKVEEKW